MTKEVAKQVVQRTKQDSAFLDLLLKDPDAALKEYKLTESEKQFFRTTDKKQLEGLSERCFEIAEQRKKKN